MVQLLRDEVAQTITQEKRRSCIQYIPLKVVELEFLYLHNIGQMFATGKYRVPTGTCTCISDKPRVVAFMIVFYLMSCLEYIQISLNISTEEHWNNDYDLEWINLPLQ